MLEIIQFTDVLCTWCWGAQKNDRAIKWIYGDQVEIIYKQGGLVSPEEGMQEGFMEHILSHWHEAAEKHLMPVGTGDPKLICKECPSSFPQAFAIKAAELQSRDIGYSFMRRLREETHAYGMLTTRMNVMHQIATTIDGLDINKWQSDIESGEAEKLFYEDVNLGNSYGVEIFPTYIFKYKGNTLVKGGIFKLGELLHFIDELSGNTLKKRHLALTRENITEYLREFGKSALAEISIAMSSDLDTTKDLLDTLVDEGKVIANEAGNSYFYHLK